MNAGRCAPPTPHLLDHACGTLAWLVLRRWALATALFILQPRGELVPPLELPHVVAGMPNHIDNGILVIKVELLAHEDETSNLAEEHSKTQPELSGEPPDTYKHVCKESISRKSDDSCSRTVHGGVSRALGWSGPAYPSP